MRDQILLLTDPKMSPPNFKAMRKRQQETLAMLLPLRASGHSCLKNGTTSLLECHFSRSGSGLQSLCMTGHSDYVQSEAEGRCLTSIGTQPFRHPRSAE